ncbi:MAG: hypothetical protein WAM89_06500 [Terriglobales bacterium]
MRRALRAICIMLVTVATSFAAPIGNGSLKGTYTFQLSQPQYENWNASMNCPNQNGGTYTVSGGGNDVSSQAITGTITFDGEGNVKGSYTQYGNFDQGLSNATIQLSCSGPVNNGYAVYDPSESGTFTGTYSIHSNGVGTMVLNPSGGGGNSPNFIVSLAGTAAVRTTVFLAEYNDPNNPNRVQATGSAVLQ